MVVSANPSGTFARGMIRVGLSRKKSPEMGANDNTSNLAIVDVNKIADVKFVGEQNKLFPILSAKT